MNAEREPEPRRRGAPIAPRPSLEYWVALTPDEQHWALDAMEFDREQEEADERDHAERLAYFHRDREPCPPDCEDYDCCCWC